MIVFHCMVPMVLQVLFVKHLRHGSTSVMLSMGIQRIETPMHENGLFEGYAAIQRALLLV